MDTHNIATPETPSGVVQIDLKEEEKRFELSLRETDRLLFAKQVLLFIFLFCFVVVVLAAWHPENKLIEQIVDLIKIGALPLITLIVSFYFPQSVKDNKQ